MLKISNLSKSYSFDGRKSDVIKNFNLEIRENQFVSIVGPNGTGKTTLFNIIAGLEKPTSGSVLYHQKSIEKYDVGYIFQNYQSSLLPWKKIIDNICMPLMFRGESKNKRYAKAEALIGQFDIQLDVDKYPYEVSGGQQQLVSILQNIIFEPKILLMDEPFSSLDMAVSLDIQNIFQNIWLKRKNIVISISHGIDQALYLANRIIVLKPYPLGIESDHCNMIPYPRNEATFTSREFQNMRNKVQENFFKLINENDLVSQL